MSRGPAPRPDHLRVLHGGKARGTIKITSPLPAPPKFLDAAGRAEWRRIVKAFDGTGILCSLDLAVVSGYCLSYARWRRAEGHIAEYGETLTLSDGSTEANPYVKVAADSLKLVRGFANDLGLTPAARTRLHMPPPKVAPVSSRNRWVEVDGVLLAAPSEDDEFDAFLDGDTPNEGA